MSDPFEYYFKKIKRIIRYIKGIIDFAIHYYKHDVVKLSNFNDLDWESVY